MSRGLWLRFFAFWGIFFAPQSIVFAEYKGKWKWVNNVFKWYVEHAQTIKRWSISYKYNKRFLGEYSEEILQIIVVSIIIWIIYLFYHHGEKWNEWAGTLLIILGVNFLFLLCALISVSERPFWLLFDWF
jgi:hypothetical protein